MSTLALILGRAGSRGVPGKNTALIAGRPCVEWSIDAALASDAVDRVAISTDCTEMMTIARRRGLDVIARPEALASDHATVDDAARHARHAVKVLVKYHLMEEREQPLAALLDWAATTPLLRGVWERWPPPGRATPHDWLQDVVADLVNGGALARDGERIRDV